MTVTTQTFAGTSQAELYTVLIDPKTYPAWLVGAKHIRDIAPDWPAKGSWFKHVVGFGPFAIADRTTIREVEPDALLELLVRARPVLEAVVRFEIVPHPGGCKLIMTENPVGIYAVVSPIAQPLIRARNERSLHRLAEAVTSYGT